MASASWCKETDGKNNYTKLCRLLVDGGTQAVRAVFDGIHPPSTLKATLNTTCNKTTLQTLKKPRGRVLDDKQWDKLYPSGSDPKSEDFDITLLLVLLRNVCGLTPPATGWDVLPPTTDNSLEANLARIKYYRNNAIAHEPSTEINDADFEQYWQDISSALLSLGLSQENIDDLKSSPLGKKDYNKLLSDWYLSDEDIKTQLHDLKSDMTDIKSQTALLPGMLEHLKHLSARMPDNDLRINWLAKEKFTFLIESLCNKYQPNTRQWILDQVKSHVESDLPKSCVLQITAGPGMGKSVIAAKICQMYKDLGCLGGCHFFQFSNSTRNNPRLMLQSIARQMCDTVPGYEEALKNKLGTNLGKRITEMSCEELFTVLFQEFDESSRKRFVVVLDAIDECSSKLKDELKVILNNKLSSLPSWIRFVITTRPSAFKSEKNVFIDPKDPQNQLDLESFFKPNVKDNDDQSEMLKQLVEVSDGLFLVAFFLIDQMKKENISSSSELKGIFPNGLLSVYEKYLGRVRDSLLSYITEEEGFYEMLEAVVASKDPIPKEMFYSFLGLKNDEDIPRSERKAKKDALNSLHSLFPIENEHVSAFHKSLVDFLIFEGDDHDYKICVKKRSKTAGDEKLPDAAASAQVASTAHDSSLDVEGESIASDTRNQNKTVITVHNENSLTKNIHDFSVRVEVGNEVLAKQCYDVLSDIRNGKKDLDKPLDLKESEKYALDFVWSLVSSTSADVRRFFNYFIIGAMILHRPIENYERMTLPKNAILDIFLECAHFYSWHDHETLCPYANPPRFGQCVEFVLQVANMQGSEEKTPTPLELLQEYGLSYCEMKTIKVVNVPQEYFNELPYISILVCNDGFFFVHHNKSLNTIVMKCRRDGELDIQKSFPGKKKVCISPNQRFLVVTTMLEKANIEVYDAETLDLVNTRQPPNVIRSCHVFGDEPWYIVIRCYNNKIYVMEGETGTVVSTIAGIGQYFEVEAVSRLGHILLGSSNRYEDGLFTDEDGNLCEEMTWPATEEEEGTRKLAYTRKVFLCHFNKPEEKKPIYPTCTDLYCCSRPFRQYDYGESVAFSQDGRFLAFHYQDTIFIRNTSDCSMYKRIYLGAYFDISRHDAIAFFNEDYVIIYEQAYSDEDVIDIIIINVHTNEITHRYCSMECTTTPQVLPTTNNEPLTFIAGSYAEERCDVLLYHLHNSGL